MEPTTDPDPKQPHTVHNRVGLLALAVFFVLSGAISREICKKLHLDIRLISILMGMLYAYVLSHYDLESGAVDEIAWIVPSISEFLVSSYLITLSFSIEFKK
jgi:hypothetical protein